MDVSNVVDAVSYWAHYAPSSVALLTDERSLSYEELEGLSNQVAHSLIQHGVKPGDRVGFILPRGIDTILLIIGILKTGAAYVPMASESPLSRIQHCFESAQPTLAIVPELDLHKWQLPCPHLALQDLLIESKGQSNAPLCPEERPIAPESVAYIIFTSGTTGKPKGVPIRHDSLLNFVLGDQETCIKVEPCDRVLHCYSPASDGHHEELWPTFLAGATLVVATDEEVHAGDELGKLMKKFEVTIVSCAPTLLSMVFDDIPTLRRILFGAENLPASLVARWWKPEREIINTYGPTEATVGTTFGYCRPGEPITIGQPLPGYRCHIVDEDLNAVTEGELAISGVGVSQGYWEQPGISAQKFIANPFAVDERDKVLYKTGDRVTINEQGNIVWLGRLDAQVKIRGHRIELTEIESHMLADPILRTATVIVRPDEDGDPRLVALIIPRHEESLDLSRYIKQLRETLPAHMIPQIFEIVDRIPVLPSGKVDRAACSHIQGRPVRFEREILPPSNDEERLVLEVWQALFKQEEVSCIDDFFADMGGNSLLASKFISEMRNERGYRSLSVIDIYDNPTIRSFSALLTNQAEGYVDIRESEPFHEIPPARYWQAKLLQGLGILILYALQAFFWLGPIIGSIYFSNYGHSDFEALVLGLTIHAVSVPLMLSLDVITKWIVLGRLKEGRYPLWGSQFLRWWFVKRMMEESPVGYLTGTPMAGVYLRLLGAKIGRNVSLDTLDIDCPDMVEIGDNASLERAAWITTSTVVNGELIVQKIKIGEGCVVGVRSGLAGGASMEAGATLSDLTCVQDGVVVPAGEEWSGIPAKKSSSPRIPRYDPSKQASPSRLITFGIIQVVLVILLTMLDAIPFQTIAFTLYNYAEDPWMYLLFEPLFAIALVVFGCAQALTIKWLVLGKLKPGTYPYPGCTWLRKWFFDKHIESLGTILVPIYDSLFARPWCQLLGMKCGPRCEIALPIRMPYDLVDMGEESFIASQVSVGMPVRRNAQIILEPVKTGNRVFLGNDAVVPQGTTIPQDFLLGVLSICPQTETLGEAPGQAWLGAPAFRMPQRHVVDQFDIRQTYKPTRKMYLERLAHEAFRIVLPSLFSLIIFAIVIEGFCLVWNELSLGWAIALLGPIFLVGALASACLCWISKKILVGKYVSTIQPLWSRFVYKAETYSTVLHDFGVPSFILPLVGSPYLVSLMRFLGAKIGKRVFLNTTDWTETDLFNIGDDTAINWNAPLQAHLFEDRVMKIGTIHIGERVSVGTFSIVLCDAIVKDDARLGHLSLVMKGETIPAATYWVGSPSQEAQIRKLEDAPIEDNRVPVRS
jgi:non-ribosomal peptide synthetase-like protein